MDLTWKTYLLVCPLVFLAGLVDAIGGGGGLISLPAYLLAGLPPHMAVATNKFSSCCGTALATGRFIKNKLVNWKLGVPSVIAAVAGSFVGAKLSLMIPDDLMSKLMLIVLPIAAIIVLNRHIFHDNPEAELILNRRTYLTAIISALVIGLYDGMYGPGTGTFLIIAFTAAAGLSMKQANAQAKVINLTTNVTALAVFLVNGQVILLLAIAAAACNMIGGYIGAGLAMKQGGKIIKPIIVVVLGLLFVKILSGN